MSGRFMVLLVAGIVSVLPLEAQKKKGSGNMKAQAQKPYGVLETTMGTIEIELFEAATPKTVKNFIGLAEQGYYNGVLFHRVIDNFMIQTGDPTGTGRGGNSIYGRPFEDEIVDTLRHSEAGILSMANRGPNTNDSQFFITLAATPWLDGKHTVFGKVVKGLEVVKSIGKAPTTKPMDRPVKEIKITSVVITRR